MIALVLAVLLQTPPGDVDEKIGEWTYMERVDPITDQRRAIAGVVTTTGTLGVKCDSPGEGSVYVSYNPGTFLGQSSRRFDGRAVLYRFDDSPPVTGPWRYTDSSALLTDNVGAFTGPLSTSERVVLRATTYRFVEETRTFQTAGAREAVSRVYAVCGDTPPPELRSE